MGYKTFKLKAVPLLFLLSPSVGLANGYHFLHQSAEGAGSAYATNGTGANDISAMFSNPSSIGRFDGTRVSSSLVIDLPSDVLRDASATAPFSDGQVAVTGTPDVQKNPIDTAFGSALYMTKQYKPDLVLGLSVTAPYAYISEYEDTAVSRYTATKTLLQAPNISPTFAYKLNDKWTLGGSLNFQYYKVELANQVATSVTNPSIATDVTSSIEGDDSGLGFSLGFEYQATPKTRIGVSYRSSIEHSFDADIAITGTPENYASLLNVASENGINITSPTGKAKFDIETPSMFQIGLLHKLDDKKEIYANANLTGWSVFEDTVVTYDNGLASTTVDNDWDDSWYIALGMGYQYNDKLKFRTGAAYDWTPTPADAVSPRAPNNDRWNIGAGFSYQKSDKIKLDFAYQYIKFTEVTIALAGGNNVPRGTLDGKIDLDAHVFMAQLNYLFD